MEYVSCAEARRMDGLRLVLSAGGPGPWSESAKAVLRARGVPFTPVLQVTLGDNDDLYAWTGTRNAPVAMYADERPRHGWLDILYLAERLGHGPSLLPDSREGQVDCIGLSHQICGQDGLGWNRRLSIFDMLVRAAGGDIAATPLPPRAFSDYDATPEAMAAASGRLIAILDMFDARIARQREAGSRYLVGHGLTAADLYFAAFSGMIEPLAHEHNPMPDYLRDMYSSGEPALRAAITPRMIAYRDHIFTHHVGLPLDY